MNKKFYNISVLGCGLVGAPIAEDLAKNEKYKVTIFDKDENSFSRIRDRSINKICIDLSNPDLVTNIVKEFDLAVSAMPGFMGYKTLEAIIKAKRNAIDIAFFPEDAFELDELAKQNNVTAAVDCGIAPGMSNLLTSYTVSKLDETKSVKIYVGGLPEKPEPPYFYKAVFSPNDVIEEYLRPARLVENKKIVQKEALTDLELIEFNGLGTLEAFNTDGLRTLIKTINAVNMSEKTIRYCGHTEKIKLLKDTGYLNENEINLNGIIVKPIDVTKKLLFPIWKFTDTDRDITLMRIIIEGKKADKNIRYTYNMIDRYDEKTNTHSMARTTGYSASAIVNLIIEGLYSKKGIIPPEYFGKDENCVKFILNYLQKRNIIFDEKAENIS
jgi:saccharopine dehydrogenase-like NADP-dependent oxidoreductase